MLTDSVFEQNESTPDRPPSAGSPSRRTWTPSPSRRTKTPSPRAAASRSPSFISPTKASKRRSPSRRPDESAIESDTSDNMDLEDAGFARQVDQSSAVQLAIGQEQSLSSAGIGPWSLETGRLVKSASPASDDDSMEETMDISQVIQPLVTGSGEGTTKPIGDVSVCSTTSGDEEQNMDISLDRDRDTAPQITDEWGITPQIREERGISSVCEDARAANASAAAFNSFQSRPLNGNLLKTSKNQLIVLSTPPQSPKKKEAKSKVFSGTRTSKSSNSPQSTFPHNEKPSIDDSGSIAEEEMTMDITQVYGDGNQKSIRSPLRRSPRRATPRSSEKRLAQKHSPTPKRLSSRRQSQEPEEKTMDLTLAFGPSPLYKKAQFRRAVHVSSDNQPELGSKSHSEKERDSIFTLKSNAQQSEQKQVINSDNKSEKLLEFGTKNAEQTMLDSEHLKNCIALDAHKSDQQLLVNHYRNFIDEERTMNFATDFNVLGMCRSSTDDKKGLLDEEESTMDLTVVVGAKKATVPQSVNTGQDVFDDGERTMDFTVALDAQSSSKQLTLRNRPYSVDDEECTMDLTVALGAQKLDKLTVNQRSNPIENGERTMDLTAALGTEQLYRPLKSDKFLDDGEQTMELTRALNTQTPITKQTVTAQDINKIEEERTMDFTAAFDRKSIRQQAAFELNESDNEHTMEFTEALGIQGTVRQQVASEKGSNRDERERSMNLTPALGTQRPISQQTATVNRGNADEECTMDLTTAVGAQKTHGKHVIWHKDGTIDNEERTMEFTVALDTQCSIGQQVALGLGSNMDDEERTMDFTTALGTHKLISQQFAVERNDTDYDDSTMNLTAPLCALRPRKIVESDGTTDNEKRIMGSTVELGSQKSQHLCMVNIKEDTLDRPLMFNDPQTDKDQNLNESENIIGSTAAWIAQETSQQRTSGKENKPISNEERKVELMSSPGPENQDSVYDEKRIANIQNRGMTSINILCAQKLEQPHDDLNLKKERTTDCVEISYTDKPGNQQVDTNERKDFADEERTILKPSGTNQDTLVGKLAVVSRALVTPVKQPELFLTEQHKGQNVVMDCASTRIEHGIIHNLTTIVSPRSVRSQSQDSQETGSVKTNAIPAVEANQQMESTFAFDSRTASNSAPIVNQEPTPVDEFKDAEVISLTQFLQLTGISFLDGLTTTKRRDTLARSSTPLDPPKLVDYVEAAAATIPELELYQFSCKELKKYISEGQAVVAQIEAETLEENPLLFSEYLSASPNVKPIMDSQFRLLKSYARNEAKGVWYRWRGQLLTGVKNTLSNNIELLLSDQQAIRKVLQDMQPTMERVSYKHAELKKRLDNLAKKQIEFQETDEEQLKEAREKLKTITGLLEKKRAEVAKLTTSIIDLENVNKLTIHKVDEEHRILKAAEARCEANRIITFSEIANCKMILERLTSICGWSIVKLHGDEIKLQYCNELEMYCSLANRRLECQLSLITGSSTKVSLFALNAIKLAIPKQTINSVERVLHMVSLSWIKAQSLRKELDIIRLRHPLRSEYIEKTGELVVELCLLFPSARSKAFVTINLKPLYFDFVPSDQTEGLCVEITINVVYGEVDAGAIRRTFEDRLAGDFAICAACDEVWDIWE